MARIGIAYEVVAAAADALLAEGRKATLAAVRERIGTGSMNTIHRHWTIWQGHQKPVPRKLSEPNTRLLSALGSELSKVAEEAASEADAALAQAMHELSVYSANGEALEAERDALAEQLHQVTTDRDILAGKGAEQAAEMARLTAELERERQDLAGVRRLLAQSELRLEAVPRLETELSELRGQLVSEQAAGTAADKAAAVAEAQRVAAMAAQAQAEARLATMDARAGQERADLAAAHAEHRITREKLTEAVGIAAAAQAELRALRDAEAERKAVEAKAIGSEKARTKSTNEQLGEASPIVKGKGRQ